MGTSEEPEEPQAPDEATTARRRPIGRRPGTTSRRQTILAAAESAFAKHGYEMASIRAIAKAAEVDAALVRHFFTSKEELFAAVMNDALQPADLVAAVTVQGGECTMGEELTRVFLRLWEGEATTGKMLGLLRSALTHDGAADMLRDFVTSRVLVPVAQAIGRPDPEVRATFVASQLVGVALTRYVVREQPMASLDTEVVVRVVGPAVQRYLTGALPLSPESDAGGSRRAPYPGR
ncbi:TetR/AcrR family transcriptional regulator [Streptomyces litchfieldiae]|uniref:TetR family transcriptional regulator n=1 Tax=Streptomyces litchfieldiae TaxID=3075543 RepID=A0ABU2N0S3_9ACTN|nr:TetR family transcriptional regulator [Streptomyces sp. DSM 44938]MDT0346919.1 TetR family transcriptional regulator [Streptomyces sp. DSM 44938]